MANFEVTTKQKCVIISCFVDLKKEAADEIVRVLNGLSAHLSSGDISIVCLDFMNSCAVDDHFLRQITAVNNAMKASGKKLFAANVPDATKLTIKNKGMDSVLKMMPKVEDVLALIPAPAPKPAPFPKLDVNFINPFIEAIIQTFKVQCSMDVQVGKPFLKEKGPLLFADIAGVVGFNSKIFNGVIAICFPERVFLDVMYHMIGEVHQHINKQMEDGAAELLNIIFGFAKRILNEKDLGVETDIPTSKTTKVINNRNYVLEKAIPTIIKGNELKTYLNSRYTVRIPFQLETGTFYLEIGIHTELMETPNEDFSKASGQK